MKIVKPKASITYTQAELEAAFLLVQNKKHWKGPVLGIVPNDKVDIVCAAINHFVYGNATVTPYDFNQSKITAPGYWAFEGQLC